MRQHLAALLLFGAAAAIGCENQSLPGGPGAAANQRLVNPADTFTVVLPSRVSLKQGEQQQATLTIDRGKSFREKVTVSFELPRGIHIEPATVTVPRAENHAVVKIEADRDAPVGHFGIRVLAKPEHGVWVRPSFDVTVEAR